LIVSIKRSHQNENSLRNNAPGQHATPPAHPGIAQGLRTKDQSPLLPSADQSSGQRQEPGDLQGGDMTRIFRFIKRCIAFRSISSAMWIDEYEQFKPDYTFKK